MDGNRRWARLRDLPELDGHAAGVEAIRALLRHAVRRGVPVLTLYAFSRENWARSDEEVDRAVRAARGGDPERDRRAPGAGRPGPAARPARRAARRDADVDRRGARCDGGRRAAAPQHRVQLRRPDRARRRRSGSSLRAGIPPEEIDEAAISDALYTAGLPDPDLVIRTGGEQRLSNFLIWQSAYAEFYTCEALWPDFGPDAFDAALLEFASRTRRFGR